MTNADKVMTEKQKKEALDVFAIYECEDRKGFMRSKDLKVAIRALGFEPKREEVVKILAELKRDNAEWLSRDDFLDIMGRKFNDKDVMKEIRRAFELFDDDRTGFISLNNLKRVAKELGEKFKDEDLREMIDEADKDGDGVVSLEEFAFIMQKTNLY